MLTFTNFTVSYKINTRPINVVIDNADFSLEKNVITGLVGLNGEGKTSMMKGILGLNNHCKYNLKIDETKINADDCINSKLKMAYVPEIPSSDSFFSVKDYFNLHLKLKKTNHHNQFNDLIKKFKLDPFLKHKIKEISKGTKKRVLIVAALLSKWDFLILDEPFEGLDINQRDILKNFMIREQQNRYILISSHEILELKEFCSKILKVDKQKVDIYNDV